MPSHMSLWPLSNKEFLPQEGIRQNFGHKGLLVLGQACVVLLDSALGMASMWFLGRSWLIPLVYEKSLSDALLSYKTSRGKK